MQRALKSAFGNGGSRRGRATDPPSVLTGLSYVAQPVHERSSRQQAWADDEVELQATAQDGAVLEEPGTARKLSTLRKYLERGR